MTSLKNTEIFFLLKYLWIIYFPIGLSKVHIYKNTIVEIGKLYKSYAIFFFTIFMSILLYALYLDSKLIIKIYSYQSTLAINAIFNYSILVITFSLVFMRNIYLDPKLSYGIYCDLLYISKLLETNMGLNKSRLKSVIFKYYFPLITFKIIYIIVGKIIWPEYNSTVRHVINTLIDFELIRFLIEANLISKILNVLRKQKNHNAIDIDRENIDVLLNMKIDVTKLNKMINIHYKLLNVIEKLNSCYSLKVIIVLLLVLFFEVLNSITKSIFQLFFSLLQIFCGSLTAVNILVRVIGTNVSILIHFI